MFWKQFGIWAAAAVMPALTWAAAPKECVAAKPTPASYTWNFRGEASHLLKGIEVDAQHALNHADTLTTFTDNPDMSWEAHASQLSSLKAEINDMGGKLCRLETIRRVVAPWQQQAIDRVAPVVQLMADNADDAIRYVSTNEGRFWVPTYKAYTTNLYNEAIQVDHDVQRLQEYAKVQAQNRELQESLHMKKAS